MVCFYMGTLVLMKIMNLFGRYYKLYQKFLKDSLDPFLNNDFIIMENIHLYTIPKAPKPLISAPPLLLHFNICQMA